MRDARCAAGLGLRGAAERAGISAGHLCNLENGQRMPSVWVLESLALAFPIPAEVVAEIRPMCPIPWEERGER